MKDTMGKKDDDSSEPTAQHKSNTSPLHKKPLTPTKDHPLMDLVQQRSPKSEFMDDSEDESDDVVVVEIIDDTKPDDVGSDGTNINDINHIPPDTNTYQTTTLITSNPDDETNNNSSHQVETVESDDEGEKGKLAPEKVVKRRKSPSRTNNNNANVKNNNRTVGRDLSQPRIDETMSKSTDKIDGKSQDTSAYTTN